MMYNSELIYAKFYTALEQMGVFSPSKVWQAIYKTIYFGKQIAGGFISPTEWVEALHLGIYGVPLEFEGGLANFFWNFGDNFLFLPFEDETTLGIFKFIGAAAIQQPWLELKPYGD